MERVRLIARGGAVVLSITACCGLAATGSGQTATRRPTPAAAPAPSPVPASAVATSASPANAPPVTRPAAAQPAVFNNGQKVQVKFGLHWRDAVVRNKGNGWILVNYAPGRFHEWVAPWRIRAVGSTQDNLPFVSTGAMLFRPQPPPTSEPPPAPLPAPAQKVGAPSAPAARMSPTAADPASANSATAEGKKATTLPTLPLKRADTAGVKRVAGAADPAWSATVDPAEQPAAITSASIPLTGGTGGPHDKVVAMILATPATPTAFIMHLNDTPRLPPESRVERVDLIAGKSLSSTPLPVPVEAHDVSRDGRLLLGASAWRNGGDYLRRLDVWDVSTSQPQHVASFKPVIDKEQADAWQEIKWARFVSPRHVLVVVHDALTCWDFTSGKAVWTATTSPVTPAVSPGGKYVAFGVGRDVVVLAEAISGKIVGTLPTGMDYTHGGLSFRRDGRLLALAGGDTVRIWDMSNGKPLFSTIADTEAFRVEFLSDGYLLLNRGILFDLNKQLPVWHYVGAEFSAAFAGRLWYVVAQRSAGKPDYVLANAQLPDARTLGEIARLGDDVYAVRPGTKVSLDVGGLPGEMQAKAKASIAKNLAAAGLLLDDGAPIRITAQVEHGKTTEMSYRPFGAGFHDAPTKMSVTAQLSKLTLTDANGNTLWERQSSTAPPTSLSLKKGETIEQAIAEQMKPTTWFFENTFIPARISGLRGGTFGTTELTPTGPTNARAKTPTP